MLFTDEELLAYADEQLDAARCALIERAMRDDGAVMVHLATLLSNRDQGAHSVGDLWRNGRFSCPPRAVWAAYVDNRLGDGMSQYMKFHIEIIGCRICSANFKDLSRRDSTTETERRTQKIFQSSAGKLHPET